jgi:hypothetical protein
VPYSQEDNRDPIVHCKFFTPDSSWTWLATEGSVTGHRARRHFLPGLFDLGAGASEVIETVETLLLTPTSKSSTDVFVPVDGCRPSM